MVSLAFPWQQAGKSNDISVNAARISLLLNILFSLTELFIEQLRNAVTTVAIYSGGWGWSAVCAAQLVAGRVPFLRCSA